MDEELKEYLDKKFEEIEGSIEEVIDVMNFLQRTIKL